MSAFLFIFAVVLIFGVLGPLLWLGPSLFMQAVGNSPDYLARYGIHHRPWVIRGGLLFFVSLFVISISPNNFAILVNMTLLSLPFWIVARLWIAVRESIAESQFRVAFRARLPAILLLCRLWALAFAAWLFIWCNPEFFRFR